jgi:CHAT domain-containing protein/tetratricopeptide (TPR) repeat protein
MRISHVWWLAVVFGLGILAGAHPAGAAQSARDADAMRETHRRLYEQGQIVPAMEAAEREVRLRREMQPPAPLELATTLYDLGTYLSAASYFARSDSLLREALALRRAGLGDSDPAVAATQVARVPALVFLHDRDEARAAAEEAYAIRRATFGDRNRETTQSLYWLARVDIMDGDKTAAYFVSAKERLDEAIQAQRILLGLESPDLARSLIALGTVEHMNGNPGRAESLQREGVAMQRKFSAPFDLRLVEGLLLLTLTFRQLGETNDAIDAVTEALTILEDKFELHDGIIDCRNTLALLNNDLRRYGESARLMRQNLEDFSRLHGDDKPEGLFLQANLALTYGYLKRFESADSLLDAATTRAEAMERDGIDVYHVMTTIIVYRARISAWSGDYARSEDYHRETLKRLALKIPEGHEAVVKTYIGMGEARAGLMDMAGALRCFDDAVRCYELARTKTGPGTGAATFQATPYEFRALCHLELGHYEDGWKDIERARGRLLSDSLLGGEVPFTIEHVQLSLRDDEAIVGWIDRELPKGRRRAWAYVIRSDGPVRWERLPCDQKESVPELAERFSRFRKTLVDAGYSAFGASEDDGSQETAQLLWKERFGSLARHLGGVKGLILIPSDAMAALPVDALVDAEGKYVTESYAIRFDPSAAIYTWLCERTPGQERAPRSGLLVGDPPFREEHLMAFVTPKGEIAGLSRSHIEPATVRGAIRQDPAALSALPRLRWSRIEIESVAKAFPEVTILIGADATEQAIARLASSGELARYDVLHLATHAFVDDVKPERSALVLAQVQPKATRGSSAVSSESGVLTAEEIGRWRLNAELVTLSACETALGRNVFGEGTIGFAYPLLRAGSRCLLASLWPVNDEATALLMSRFYLNWLGDASGGNKSRKTVRTTKAEALRDAKAWLRDWRDEKGARPYRHPYYWAPFVLVGR